MLNSSIEILTTPRRDELDLLRIANGSGLSVSVLPTGAIFAIEHTDANRRIVINQTLALPIADGMARLYVRTGGGRPLTLLVIGPETPLRVGSSDDRYVWEGEESGVRHQVTLWLHPRLNAWFWRVEVANDREEGLPCDAVLIQDLGLGDQGFLMNNEAYASQYLDHHVAHHPRLNHVLMGRQNLSQGGVHPWVAHGCLEGAAGYATDFRQLMGPAYRDADQLDAPFGANLPSERLQYETACAALQSKAVTLEPGGTTSWTFFGFFESDHPAASSDVDLSKIDAVERASADWAERDVLLSAPPRSLLHEARSAVAETLDEKAIKATYRKRTHVERAGDQTSVSLCSRKNAQPPRRSARKRTHGRPTPRFPGAQWPGAAPRRDNFMRDGMDARGLRGADHHRQHVIPQTFFCFPRSLQHHPRERSAHVDGDEGRMAVVDRAVRFRDGPQRLPLDLPAGPANRHGLGNCFRRRTCHAVARHCRRPTMPFSRFRSSCSWGARVRSRWPG